MDSPAWCKGVKPRVPSHPLMSRIIRRYGTGLHVVTPGTSWLEAVLELDVARQVHTDTLACYDERAAVCATNRHVRVTTRISAN